MQWDNIQKWTQIGRNIEKKNAEMTIKVALFSVSVCSAHVHAVFFFNIASVHALGLLEAKAVPGFRVHF